MTQNKETPRNYVINRKNAPSHSKKSKPVAHISKKVAPQKLQAKTTRKKPSQERSKETVEIILTAARELFVELGFAGTTTNKIAARAGVSIGSLYQYFPNKTVLLGALYENQMKAQLPIIENCVLRLSSPEQSLQDNLRLLVKAVVHMHEVSPALHDILMIEAKRMPQMQRMRMAAEKRYVSLTADVLKKIPIVRAGNHQMMANILVQSVEELSHWMVTSGLAGAKREAAFDEIVQLLFRYIASEDPEDPHPGNQLGSEFPVGMCDSGFSDAVGWPLKFFRRSL
ncbi:MAG: TetR/AcrR family transcriptional regulator [Deltaproteobacteria bacterium]|nr:TetR/AcrR family transcriptional regulator [Deltaproteobacteria bacterium]MBN2672578.1 TetR/AcrR family transcriptional regulator [Deltaproteobacteria bacterium]